MNSAVNTHVSEAKGHCYVSYQDTRDQLLVFFLHEI